jgi:hypothetical protein
MRGSIVVVAATGAALAAACIAWRRDRRLGSGFVNRVVDPILMERGLSGAGRSEIGTLEHVGRTTGTRRLTPVHPVATETGFRIIVPLGQRSQWARNVLAAGHCRLQIHDVVHELDEPTLLQARDVPGISPVARWLGSLLGFDYLVLRSFSRAPGSLLESPAAAAPDPRPEREMEAATP